MSDQEVTNQGQMDINSIPVEVLRRQADRAYQEYDYEKAVEIYTQALEINGLDGPIRYELIKNRAECYERLGNEGLRARDLKNLSSIANGLSDDRRKIEAMYLLAVALKINGKASKARELYAAAINRAEVLDDKKLIADCLTANDEIYDSPSKELSLRALQLYQELDDKFGQFHAYSNLANSYYFDGDLALAMDWSQKGLIIAPELGDRFVEGWAYNLMAACQTDLQLKREFYERVLAICQDIHTPMGLSLVYNNLGFYFFYKLGLYESAFEYARNAVQLAREMQNLQFLSINLEAESMALSILSSCAVPDKPMYALKSALSTYCPAT